MWQNKLRRFFTYYSTPICDLCGLTMKSPISDSIWCHHCLKLFSPTPRCQTCGLSTLTTVQNCGSCLSTPPLWNKLYCVGNYQVPLSNYVGKLKHLGQPQYAYDLSYLLAKQIPKPAPILTTMPLHWRRYAYRGYNQSHILGYYLKYHLKTEITFAPHLFTRIKATPSQQGLNKQQRIRNLNQAFLLNYRPNQTHIAIIDDVVTTGSSVQQLCKLLLDVGVEKIDIYCICRTGI